MTSGPSGGAYPAPPSWLAAIPGYSGYRAKEQRRQADRALREDLARRVTTSVQHLQRLSAGLARERRYADLAPVDELTRRLQHLSDRLLTAPEGYRALFADERIDEAVLDQIIAFDRSLASGIDRLVALSSTLSERSPSPVLASPAGVELTELADRLMQRLDARTSVMTSGQTLAPEAALAVLQPPAPPPAPPLTLKPGDAVSYAGTDYLVDATIAYRGEQTWTDYRLRDGSAERWLVVEPAATALLAPVAAETISQEADGGARLGDRVYRLLAHGEATATLRGPSGEQRNVPVTYSSFGDDAGGRLALRAWGAERVALQGEVIDVALLSVFPRA